MNKLPEAVQKLRDAIKEVRGTGDTGGAAVEVIDREDGDLPGLDRMKEEILKVRSEISGLRTEIRALEEAL